MPGRNAASPRSRTNRSGRKAIGTGSAFGSARNLAASPATSRLGTRVASCRRLADVMTAPSYTCTSVVLPAPTLTANSVPRSSTSVVGVRTTKPLLPSGIRTTTLPSCSVADNSPARSISPGPSNTTTTPLRSVSSTAPPTSEIRPASSDCPTVSGRSPLAGSTNRACVTRARKPLFAACPGGPAGGAMSIQAATVAAPAIAAAARNAAARRIGGHQSPPCSSEREDSGRWGARRVA